MKKSVDVEKILKHPRQSWAERLIAWGLSKPSIAAIFIAITGWFGKASAQTKTQENWDIIMGKVTESFQYSRRFIILTPLFLMIISILLACFRKISWFWSFCILSWMFAFIGSMMIIDYITEESPVNSVVITGKEATSNSPEPFGALLALIAGLIVGLLPVFISLIRFKMKKIDKKILKRRLLIWLLSGLFFGIIICSFALFLS